MPAVARRWELVFERGGYRVFVDVATLQVEGGIARAWLRAEYPKLQPASNGWPAHRSLLEHRRIDCSASTSGVTDYAVYAESGAVGEPAQRRAWENAIMEPVQPGTVGEAVQRAICRRAR